MSLYKIFQEEDNLIGIWKIEESLEELNALLPNPEMYNNEIIELRTPIKKMERIAVRVLLYKLLKEQKQILYHVDGSPYLFDKSAQISISHTRGYVAVIVGKSRKVGIDIEQYGERVQRLSSKFMREDEFPSQYKQTTTWALLLHWSAKETMFKMLHCQAVDFRKHLFITPFEVHESGELHAQEFRTVSHHHFAIKYVIEPDFVMTHACLDLA